MQRGAAGWGKEKMKEGVECSLEGRGTEQTYFERQNACLELREGCCSASVELGLGGIVVDVFGL